MNKNNILVIIIIASIVIFALLLNMKKIDNKPSKIDIETSDNNIPIITEEPFISETPTFNSDISNWKTYRNEKYGVKFKYPKDWNGGETEFDLSKLGNNNIYKRTETEIEILFGKKELQGATFVLWVMNRSINEAIEYDHSSFGDKTGNTTFIGGLKGEMLDGAFYGMQYVVKDGKTYFFEQINAENEQDRKDYDEIMKTFEFVIPNAETLGWKTYINDKYKFQLAFPPSWDGYISNTDMQEMPDIGKYDTILFGFDAQYPIFNISVFTIEQWEKFISLEVDSGRPMPDYMEINEKYVFSVGGAQYNANQEMLDRMNETGKIVSTFQFIK